MKYRSLPLLLLCVLVARSHGQEEQGKFELGPILSDPTETATTEIDLRNVRRICVFGDSLTGYGNGGPSTSNLHGFSDTLRTRSGGRLEFIKTAGSDLAFSFGGASAAKLLAEVPGALAQCTGNNDVVMVWESPNNLDVTGTAAAADGFEAIWDAFIAGGVKVIGCECTPRMGNANAPLLSELNAILRVSAKKRSMLWIEWAGAINGSDSADFTTAHHGDPHPSVQGQVKLGIAAHDALANYLGDPIVPRFVTPNSPLSGASGGIPPTGWSVLKSPSLSVGDFSYVEAKDGGNPWLQFDVTSNADKDYVALYIPRVESSIWSGNTEAASSCELEFETLSGLSPYKVGQRLQTYGGIANIYTGLTSSANDAQLLAVKHEQPDLSSGRTDTPWATINQPSKWTAARAYSSTVYFHAGSVCRIRMRNCGIKVR